MIAAAQLCVWLQQSRGCVLSIVIVMSTLELYAGSLKPLDCKQFLQQEGYTWEYKIGVLYRVLQDVRTPDGTNQKMRNRQHCMLLLYLYCLNSTAGVHTHAFKGRGQIQWHLTIAVLWPRL